MKIGFVTDSTADRLLDEYKEHDIVMVPLVVRFGDELERDWIDIDPEEFYRRMRASDVLPQTSQPTVQDFVDAYKNLANKKCDRIISIHLTSKLSGTVRSAEAAANMVKDEIPVKVIDSEVISLLLWAVILRIDAARRAGEGFNKIIELINECKRRAKLFFMVDTMKYLEQGGRVGKAQAFLGQILAIKPILTLTDGGTPTPQAKASGTKAALREMVALVKREIDARPADQEITLLTAHADSPDMLAYLEGLVKEADLRHDNKITGWIGSVVGSYVGPGTIAIGIL